MPSRHIRSQRGLVINPLLSDMYGTFFIVAGCSVVVPNFFSVITMYNNLCVVFAAGTVVVEGGMWVAVEEIVMWLSLCLCGSTEIAKIVCLTGCVISFLTIFVRSSSVVDF